MSVPRKQSYEGASLRAANTMPGSGVSSGPIGFKQYKKCRSTRIYLVCDKDILVQQLVQ